MLPDLDMTTCTSCWKAGKAAGRNGGVIRQNETPGKGSKLLNKPSKYVLFKNAHRNHWPVLTRLPVLTDTELVADIAGILQAPW